MKPSSSKKRKLPSPNHHHPIPSTVTTIQPKGLPEKLGTNLPLRLIIVGHNPSETAWKLGHYYANPSNWLWRILKETGIINHPSLTGTPTDDDLLPELLGIGFTDLGSGVPGTNSLSFSSKQLKHWKQGFYDRLKAHVRQASSSCHKCGSHSNSNNSGGGGGMHSLCGAPSIIAFSGKRQFLELFDKPGPRKKKRGGNNSSNHDAITTTTTSSNITYSSTCPAVLSTGRQSVLPSDWPLSPASTEVWMMTSTSGAAAMTKEQRYKVWRELGERLKREPWPRLISCSNKS